jgi:hypothetical protein
LELQTLGAVNRRQRHRVTLVILNSSLRCVGRNEEVRRGRVFGPASLIGDIGGVEVARNHLELGVGAREHGHRAPRRSRLVLRGEPGGDVFGLLRVGVITAHHRDVTIVLRRHDALRARLEQGIRHFNDVRGRTVVPGEVEHDRVGPGADDLLEQLRVRAVESVDGLVWVTDAEEIGIVAGHLSQHRELQGVHVLGFVDVDRLVVVSKGGEDIGLVAQQRNRFAQEEVEVQHATTATESDVAIEDFGELTERQRCLPAKSARTLHVERAVEALRERPANLLLNSRELPLLEFEVAAVAQLHRESRDESSSTRLEGEWLEVLVLAVLGDDAECHAVKRSGAHVADARAEESFSKLVARFARERHCQYLVGTDLLVRDAPLDPQRQDVGLTRTGGRSNE